MISTLIGLKDAVVYGVKVCVSVFKRSKFMFDVLFTVFLKCDRMQMVYHLGVEVVCSCSYSN